jgi:two-component system cell cycle response regulator
MAVVLVVEDQEVNLALISYLLKAYKHEVVAARDAEQGLALARERLPDLVLCDIELPGMSGVEFARQMRSDAALRQVPLLAVTANAMRGDREHVLASGFDGYAAKPIDPQNFVGWLEGFLRRPGAQAVAPVVLVVDDVPVNLMFKRSCLEPLGYKVLAAASPAEALTMARFNPPDLILSDVGMPEGDGFDFIAAVKGTPALRDVPFIFITSTHRDVAAQQRAMRLGAHRYLHRPMPVEELIAEVRACVPSPGEAGGGRRPGGG